MQKVISVLALLLALPLLAQAQEAPRLEAFGGYSYLRLDQDTNAITNGDQDLNGFNASVTYNFNSVLGATAEISGNFANQINNQQNTDRNTYLFLVGPKFAFRGNERFTPFAHVLLGVVRQDISQASQAASGTGSFQTQFAMAVGGGLDVAFGDRLSLRPAQVDLILTRLNTTNAPIAQTQGLITSTNQYNVRISTGLVVKLGEQ
jgi:opacity protein-like surface antigen